MFPSGSSGVLRAYGQQTLKAGRPRCVAVASASGQHRKGAPTLRSQLVELCVHPRYCARANPALAPTTSALAPARTPCRRTEQAPWRAPLSC